MMRLSPLRKACLIFIAAICFVFASPPAYGQGNACGTTLPCSGNITALNNAVSLSVPSYGSYIQLVVSGTFTGTLQFEQSTDFGNTWQAALGAPQPTGTSVTSATAAGTWLFPGTNASTVKLTNFRVRDSAYSTGTAVAAITPLQLTLCSLAGPCTGGITISGGDVVLPVEQDAATVVVTVAGTFTGTLLFQQSADGGATYQSSSGTPQPSGTAVTQTTTTGQWRFVASGLTNFQVIASTSVTGTANVTIYPSRGSAASNGTSSPLSTEGDLYAFLSGTNNRLPIGSTGTCLTSNGTDPLWGSCAGATSTNFSGIIADAPNTHALQIGAAGSLSPTSTGIVYANKALLNPSVTGGALFNLGSAGVAPTAPNEADMWYLAASHVPQWFDGTNTNTAARIQAAQTSGNLAAYSGVTGLLTGYAGATSCTNQFMTGFSAAGASSCTTDTLASAQHANQGTTSTVLHGNGAGNPSWAGVSLTGDATANQGTTTTLLHGNAAGQPSWAGVSLTNDATANQGTTTTVLHGNAAGQPSFASVVSADLNITGTTCTNQFVSAISSGAAGTCTSASLTGAQFANQGTTTTVLHGNASGNPSFAGVSLANDTAANQGTTTTVLHGNGSGQPSFGVVVGGDFGGSVAADSVFGNFTGSPAAPGFSTSALPSSLIPISTAAAVGGVQLMAGGSCAASQFVNGVNVGGTLLCGTAPGAGSVAIGGSPANGELTYWTGPSTVTGLTGTQNTIVQMGAANAIGLTPYTLPATIVQGTVPYAASTGAVTFSATPIIAEAVAPSTPASNYGTEWIDSTDHRFHDKNPSATIGTTVVADTGGANHFLTAISAAGVVSDAQPTLANIAAGSSPSGTFDYTGATHLYEPTASSAVAAHAGEVIEDTAAGYLNYHIYAGGADAVVCSFASAPVTGDLVSVTISTHNILCSDAGTLAANTVTAASNYTSAGLIYAGGANKTTANSADFTVSSHTLTGGASSVLDLHAAATSGFLLPGGLTSGLVRVTTSTGAIASAELSGDCTTSGSNALTCTKLNNTSFAGTSGNLVSFGAANIPADSSVVAANVVTASSVYTSSGDLVQAAGNNRTTSDSGVAAANLVTAASAFTSGDLVQAAASNKTTSDSSIAAANVVTAASTYTSGGLVYSNGTAKTTANSADFTISTHTLASGANGLVDLHLAGATGLQLPGAAAPTADGYVGYSAANHTDLFGSNGTTMVAAVAVTGSGNTSTTCSAHNWISTISGVANPSCSQPGVSDLSSSTSSQLATVLSDEVGTGYVVFNTSPKIVTSILDTNGNAIIGLSPTGSAAGYLTIANAAAGTPTVALSATSGYNLNLVTSGGGAVQINGSSAGTGTVTTSGSPTTGALVTMEAAAVIQTPSATATMDSSGNISTPGTITSGSGSSSHYVQIPEGTPTGSAGSKDTMSADGTSHTMQWSNNGGSFYSGAQFAVTNPTAHGVVLANSTFPLLTTTTAGNSGAPFLSGGSGADGAYGALNLAGGSNVVTGTLPAGNLPGSGVSTINGASSTIGSSVSVTQLFDSNAYGAIRAVATGSANTYLNATDGAAGSPAVFTLTAVSASTSASLNLVSQGASGVVEANGTPILLGSAPAATAVLIGAGTQTVGSVTTTAKGDLLVGSGSGWTLFAGNNSGTKVLTEASDGSLSWGSGGAGSVTVSGSPAQYDFPYWTSGTNLTKVTAPAVNGLYFMGYDVTGSAALAPAATAFNALPAGTVLGSQDTASPTMTFNSTYGVVFSGTQAVSTAGAGANATGVLRVAPVKGQNTSGTAQLAGNGSSPSIVGGQGGDGTGTNSIGGTGGNILLTSGDGGASTGTAASSDGGSVIISLGEGQTGSTGPIYGQLIVQGNTTVPSSSGGGYNAGNILTIDGVTGGATTGTSQTAGIGSSLLFNGGQGGPGNGGTNSEGGPGGPITFAAGAGGVSGGTAANNQGGSIYFEPGAAGSGGSGTPGTLGNIYVQAAGTFNMDLRNTTSTAVSNSPALRFLGEYEATSGPTYAQDIWSCKDVVSAGVNGASTLTCTQSGSSGAAAVSLPALNLTSPLTGTYGGTGVNNGASTITLAGNLVTTGAYNATFALGGSATFTMPLTNQTIPGIGQANTWTGVQAFTPAARASGVAAYFPITTPADTGQTASTESNGVSLISGTRTWATGTVAAQREVMLNGPTYAGASATATFTDAATLGITPPIVGANAAITRNHSLAIVDSTSAASSITGGLVVAAALGTTATSVGIGGGNINAGGTITTAGNAVLSAGSTAHAIEASLVCAAASSSGTAYTCSTTPTFTPAAGDTIIFQPDLANSGTSATLKVNGQTGTPAISEKAGTSTTLVAADIKASPAQYLMMYDGTTWEIASTLGNAATGGGISGLTTGRIPQATSATAIGDTSPVLDNGVSAANTLTYAGTSGIASPQFTSTGSGPIAISSTPGSCGSSAASTGQLCISSTTNGLVYSYNGSVNQPITPRNLFNFNASLQSFGQLSGATPVYVAGSNINVPASLIQGYVQGTSFKWRMAGMSKDANGTGVFSFIIYVGTNGTTSDTVAVNQNWGTAQSAAADTGSVDITATITSVIGSTATVFWTISPEHHLTSTGFCTTSGGGGGYSGTFTFNSTTASLIFGLGIETAAGGTLETPSIATVQAEAFNLY